MIGMISWQSGIIFIGSNEHITGQTENFQKITSQPYVVVTNDVLHNSDDGKEDVDAGLILKNMRLSNKSNLLIAHLNINSIRNKLEALKCLISRNIVILIIAETKIDETFPTNQFLIDGYMPPLRADRN